MPSKLDPRLLEAVERTVANIAERERLVDVLVALNRPLDSVVRGDLTGRGLSVRTDAGTILTASVALGRVNAVAESPHVLKLELSSPLFGEPGGSGGEGPA